jgi:hypothetical protein
LPELDSDGKVFGDEGGCNGRESRKQTAGKAKGFRVQKAGFRNCCKICHPRASGDPGSVGRHGFQLTRE